MTTFNELREQVAYAVGDPFMERVNRDHIAGFINSAARDIRNSGWLVRMQHVESIQLLSDNYEYDVPLRFAYIKELRVGDTSSDNASTVDSGTELDGAIATAGATTVDVDDGTIFTVSDMIQVEDEIMLITAISSDALTVERGYFGTTAATHDDTTTVYRPLADIRFDTIIPRAYWRMKTQSGGSNTTTAAKGDRPQFIFDKRFFSFTSATPIQVIGQRRPTTSYSSGDTIDQDMESFLLERATQYAARFRYAQGDAPHLLVIYQTALSTSTQFLRNHPMEFRVRPNSTLVPGR